MLKKLNKKIKTLCKASKDKIPKLIGKGKELKKKMNKLMAKRALVMTSIGNVNKKIIKHSKGPDHMKDPITLEKFTSKRTKLIKKFKKLRKQIKKLQKAIKKRRTVRKEKINKNLKKMKKLTKTLKKMKKQMKKLKKELK